MRPPAPLHALLKRASSCKGGQRGKRKRPTPHSQAFLAQLPLLLCWLLDTRHQKEVERQESESSGVLGREGLTGIRAGQQASGRSEERTLSGSFNDVRAGRHGPRGKRPPELGVVIPTWAKSCLEVWLSFCRCSPVMRTRREGWRAEKLGRLSGLSARRFWSCASRYAF